METNQETLSIEDESSESKQPDKVITRTNDKALNFFVSFLVLAIVASSGFWFGFQRGKEKKTNFSLPLNNTVILNKEGSSARALDFSLFWHVWDLLKEKYVDTQNLDANKLFYGAIKGMLAATGDPYTTFFDPEENKRFNDEIKGSFEGIGAEIGMRGGILTIVAPLAGSPAEKAGILAGDKVIEIDGKSTLEDSIDASVSRMRGPKDTEVKLKVIRENVQDAMEISIIRGVIKVKSVNLEFKENDSIAYLRVSQFGEETASEFNLAVADIYKKNVKGIILDLRNDPGGYLDAAVKLASRMLPKGKVVVSEEDGNQQRESLYTKGGDVLSGIKTVVLINAGSASASEILAGALRENRDNVVIMGEKSFGKGSVQEKIELPGGSAAKITISKWLTPNGNQINERGINPDIEIKLTTEDYNSNKDPQLEAAIKNIQQ